MRNAAPVLGWAGVLIALAVTAYVFAPHAELQWLLLAGAAAAALTIGATLVRVGGAEGPRLLPDSSFATVAFALGLVLTLNGLVFGLWLVLVGAGTAALGAAGLVRERLASTGRSRR